MTVNVTTFPAGSLVGAPVRRVEDPDLLTGRGTYIDNLKIDGMLELAFVRSTVAHARLESVDTSDLKRTRAISRPARPRPKSTTPNGWLIGPGLTMCTGAGSTGRNGIFARGTRTAATDT